MTSIDSGTGHVREKISIHQTKMYSDKLQNELFTCKDLFSKVSFFNGFTQKTISTGTYTQEAKSRKHKIIVFCLYMV